MNSGRSRVVRQATVLLVATALSLATSLGANTPISFSFPASAAPVYDLTGSYQFNHQVLMAGGSPLDISVCFSVQQDASGWLRGSGVTNIYIGKDLLTAAYSVNGRVSGGGGKVTRVALSARWVGQATAGGVNTPSKSVAVSVLYNLNVSSGGLTGAALGSARFEKLGSGRIKSSISGVPLPSGVDGSWIAEMNFAPPSSLGGAASVILPNGRNLQTSLAGSPSIRSGLVRARLSGLYGDRGNTLDINFFPDTRVLQSLSGKILGQTVKVSEAAGARLSSRIVGQAVFSPPAPIQYAGSQACIECHGPRVQTVSKTPHAQVGVDCESCHGPAADHAANDYDPVVRPRVDLTGAVCGACHSGPQHPIYEEWQTSAHASVVPGAAAAMNASQTLVDSCGRCHSGAARLSLLEHGPLPTGATNAEISCAVCHDPHAEHTYTNVLSGRIAFTNVLSGRGYVFTNDQLGMVYTNQLRNPYSSTNDYFITTSGDFTSQYQPNVNLCAQCHNDRGASWTEWSRPPHPSLQYNMLLGTVGELASGAAPHLPGEHSWLEKQCVACHMTSAPYQSDAQPAVTGHSFKVTTYSSCIPCHGPSAQGLAQLVQGIVSNQVQVVKGDLDRWAVTKADASLQAGYGANAWEYADPGELPSTGPGPANAALQALIPVNIQKARFNMYLVFNDGSLGIHNPFFALHLLGVADEWVQEELNAPSN